MDFRAALLDQTRDFGELIRGADPSTPVPTCPDWTLKQLFRHVGRGNRWAAQIIADRRSEPSDPRDVRNGKPPDDPDGAIDWLNDGAQLIIDAVDQVGPETRVWTFLGPRPAGWWIRRRLHEAVVHRADAAMALGVAYELSPELAADAISEWIELMAEQRQAAARRWNAASRCICTPPTTGSGRPASGRSSMTRTACRGRTTTARADVALRGPAKDLLMAIDTAANGGRSRHRGVRRRRPVGQVAGAHAILSGVPSRP